MVTRVPHVGARATIGCGCLRTSVAELIGMFETIALGRWSTFAGAFPEGTGDAPGAYARVSAQTVLNNAAYRFAAMRLKYEAR